jgi:RNA polymerase sigma factor (sigma-70 family)
MDELITINALMTAEKNARIKDIFLEERKRLAGFIRNKVANAEDAEDILQETFYELSDSFSILEPIEKVASWLYKVASNKIIDLYRKKKTESLESINQTISKDFTDEQWSDDKDLFLIPYVMQEDNYTRSLIWTEIETSLEELPKEQREVFVMHELEDKSFKEMTELTGESINTLISRKRYAVLYLRERLQDLYNELLNN